MYGQNILKRYDAMWTYEPTDEYGRRRKRFAKKQPKELAAAHDNLDAYFQALEMGANPLNISSLGYVHDEGRGVYAVDQKLNNSAAIEGVKKRKLNPIRLYFYPEIESRKIWLLTIGDKESQQGDVTRCHQFVERRRREIKDGTDKQNIHEPQRTH